MPAVEEPRRTCRRCGEAKPASGYFNGTSMTGDRPITCRACFNRAGVEKRAAARPTTLDRFEDKYEPEPNSGCWIWFGAVDQNGYGVFGVKGQRAHRWSYERYRGPIPEGLQIDHLCRTRCCVNPAHLEPVTGEENLLRAGHFIIAQRFKTHCKHGHEFTPENTVPQSGGRGRACKTCRARLAREKQERKRAEREASR